MVTDLIRTGFPVVEGVQIRCFFWSAFSRIWAEYRESISPYSVRMRENTHQKFTWEITSIVWKAESKHSETLKLKHKQRTFLRNFLLWLSNYIIEEGRLFMLQFQSFWVFRLWISNGIGNFPRSWGTRGSAGPEVPGVHEILRYWASLGPRSPGGPGGSGGPGVPGLGPTFLPCQVAFCKK